MSKGKTISTRWKEWTAKEPTWAYSALVAFFLAVGVGLTMHLAVQSGLWRTVGLVMLIGFDVILLGITAFRRQWWWFCFFCYITIGVIVFEIASYLASMWWGV